MPVVIFKVASLTTAGLPNAMWPPWKKQYMGKNDDVIKWKHFPRYWPFVRGIHQSPVNSPHKGQWRGALMFSMICSLTCLINGWVNNREAGDLRRHLAHYDVIVMCTVTIYMYLQWWYSRLTLHWQLYCCTMQFGHHERNIWVKSSGTIQ